MPLKYPQILNLDKLNVYKEDHTDHPHFFILKNLPNILSYGKHYFTLGYNYPNSTNKEFSNLKLRHTSQVLFEFKDKNGNVIFSDLTDTYDDVSGAAIGYVWVRKDPLRIAGEIADGIGYMTIVGELEGVPKQWEDKYNVRLTIPVEIRKDFINRSPILFQSASLIQTNTTFSESMESDTDSSNYKRAYINVSSSNMETYGGRVSFVELSYKENTSNETEFKNLTTYGLTGSMTEFTSSNLSIQSSLNNLNPPSHEYKFPLPLDTRRGNNIEFKLRFLNPNMEVAQNIFTGDDINITSSNMYISGSPLIIEKDDNLLSGSLFIGSKTEPGQFATKMSFDKVTEAISFKGDNSDTDGIEFYEGGNNSMIMISGSVADSTQIAIRSSVNSGLQFSQLRSHRLLLYSTGRNLYNFFNIGIPASASLPHPTGTGLYINQGNTFASDPEIFISASGGNVGIGTNTPSATLHVAGNLKVDEGMEVLGAITSSIISSSILYSSGSTIFGDAIGDTHTFNGHITASGDISASGDLYVDNIYLEKGNFIQFGSADTYISASGTTEDLILAADDDIILEPDGYVHNQKAYYHGATSTGNNVAIKIGNFSTDDMIRFYAGGGLVNPHMIVADDLVTVGAHNLTDVDFKVGNNHIYVDDGLGKTAIGKAPTSADKEFTVEGDISSSGGFFLENSASVGYSASKAPQKGMFTVGYGTIHEVTGSLTNPGDGYGDVVSYASVNSSNAGDIVYMRPNNGTWNPVDANNNLTSYSQLGVYLGGENVLLRGFVKLNTISGSSANSHGVPIYAAEDLDGSGSYHAPSNDGDIVRIVGHTVGVGNNVIYFNPSHTYIEIS